MPDDSSQLFGRPTPRIDGIAKVTGRARYPADEPVANPAFAYLVTSGIARGRISGFKLDQATDVDGIPDALGRGWQFDMLDAELGERINDGVRDRRQPRRDPALAAAAHAERICRRRHL